jgi:GNAT superfamily N-acetyltransferase
MNLRLLQARDLVTLQERWNATMHPDFRLRSDVIQSQIVDSPDVDWTSSFVIEDKGTILGGIVVKVWKRDILPRYADTAWITWIFVEPAVRNQGVGRRLMNAALDAVESQGVKTVHIGKDMNNLFCGVADVFESDGFFRTMGFVSQDTSYDMHRHVIGADPLPLRKQMDYEVRLSTPADEAAGKDFFHRVFPGRWEEEYLEYLARGNTGKEFVFLFDGPKVIAFCRINHNRQSDNMYNTLFDASFETLYGVGPLGVDPDYRGLSLGFDVTAYAINEAIALGASDIIIDWTSLVDLYRKFGFEIWHAYTSFTKTL